MHHIFCCCHKVPITAEWRPRVLSCSSSLNSHRSYLQTAAEFWQILPWCLRPLGDIFLFFLSSALVFTPWSTGPSSYCQFFSPSMSEKPNGFTGFTVNLSLFPGLWMWDSIPFRPFYFPTVRPFMMTWSFFSLNECCCGIGFLLSVSFTGALIIHFDLSTI